MSCKKDISESNQADRADQDEKIKSMSEKIKQLEQINEILMSSYDGSREDLTKTVQFLNELNKINKYLIIDQDRSVGFISNIKINDLYAVSAGEIEIIDFSKEPRMVTEEGYEKIKMLS